MKNTWSKTCLLVLALARLVRHRHNHGVNESLRL